MQKFIPTPQNNDWDWLDAYDKIPDFEDYGLGCFLLASSEVNKMK